METNTSTSMVGLMHPLMLLAELSSYAADFGLEKGFKYCLFQIMFGIFGLGLRQMSWTEPV